MNRLLLWLNKISLIKKLIISYILIIAIPGIFVGIYTFKNVRNGIIEEMVNESQLSVQQTLDNIKRNVESSKIALHLLIGNQRFINEAFRLKEADVPSLLNFKNNIYDEVSRIKNANANIYRLCVYVKDPDVMEFFPIVYNEKRFADEEILERIINSNNQKIWDLYHSDTIAFTYLSYENNKITSLYIKLKNSLNEYIGFAEVSMRSNIFYADIFSNNQSNNSFFCILDNNGQLIYYNKNSLVQSLNFEPMDFYQLIKANTTSEKGSFKINFNNENLSVVYGYSEDLNAWVYQISSINSIAEKLNSARNTTILSVIVGILIISIVTYFITSVIMKKVRIIKQYMQKVEIGDLAVTMPSLGHDEIGELAQRFQKMMDRVNELIILKMKNQEAIRESELNALSAQINSHFTYNTLDTIQMMAEVDEKYELADAVNLLGKMMRYGITFDTQNTTLKNELNHVKNYISLINIKYDELVTLSIYVNEDLMAARIPIMTLQPIVENSIFHGIKSKANKGIISIDAQIKDSMLIIEIFDNGKGISQDKLQQLKSSMDGKLDTFEQKGNDSIGIRNVNDRIQLYYGKQYGIAFESEENIYTKVIISLPYISHDIQRGSGNEESTTG